MSVKCQMFLLGLLTLCSLLTGTSGAEDLHVFCSSGEDVSLPCNNARSDCKSTTWVYSRHSEAVELVAAGTVRTDRERHESRSLGSHCSLNIKEVTKEDYGSYTCRQYVNEQQQGADARVFLQVLHVSSSSSQTEISPGRSVTLSCRLYHHVSCDTLRRIEGVDLIWVNQAGVNLMTDSRYQISFSSSHCTSTLTTTLKDEDHNRQWRCQLTQRNQLKTSATYTVKYSASEPTPTHSVTPDSSSTTTVKTSASPKQPASVATVLPDCTTNSGVTPALPKELVIVIVVAAVAVLLVAVIVCVILKRRVGDKRVTNNFVVTDMNTFTETNDKIDISIHPAPNATKQNDEVAYTEVVTYSKSQANKGHEDDKVTYSSIRGGKTEPPDDCNQLYATVNKNRHYLLKDQ